jgi:hypothetical protein
MRHKIFFIACMALTALLSSCKKDDAKKDSYKCASCKTTPDALAVNDNSSKGIYKGIITGSTGTIMFDVMNGGTTITATMVLDGVTTNLTSSISWTNGNSYVAPFTGTLNGVPVTITFSVDANGGNPTISSSNIPGHTNAQFILAKESSTFLIEAFEGKYETTKPEKGTFNILLSRTLLRWGGIHRKDGDTVSEDMDGAITSDGKLMEDGTNYVGTLDGDVINGTFKDSEQRTVTVTGKRTL